MSDVLDIIKKRRSVRSFEYRQIDDSEIQHILECGLHAATAMNRQSWHFTVVQNRDFLNEISQAVADVMIETGVPSLIERAQNPNFSTFHHAPTVIFISSDGTDYSMADCANAAQNMCVAATALGLGSCYIASFVQALEGPSGTYLRNRFSLPEGYSPVFSVALGYATGQNPSPPERSWKVSYIR